MAISMLRLVSVALTSTLVAGGGYLGYQAVRSDIEATTYRERLAHMVEQYEGLRTEFNSAVRKTAVTELLVEDDDLAIVVRRPDGTRERIPTDLDPRGEVYVDYVVIGGRLLIRRVFDSWTAPADGVVLEPGLVEVDWDDPRAEHGKAVYRALADGRWVVSVTGSGALGLVRLGDVDATLETDLVHAPEITDFSELVEETDVELEGVGAGDVWRWVTQ